MTPKGFLPNTCWPRPLLTTSDPARALRCLGMGPGRRHSDRVPGKRIACKLSVSRAEGTACRDAINPSWSWDGTKIAFAGQTTPGGPFAVYIANADGSGPPQQVTTPPVSDTDPTWSPTGSEIAFVRARSDGSKRIFIG